MAKSVQITVTVRASWWLRLYLSGVVLCAQMTGLEPDWQKVQKVVRRGLTFKVE